MKFPNYIQPDTMDCGPTCIRIIAKFYGRSVSLHKLRKLSETTREGTSLKNISICAEAIGLKTLGVKINFLKFSQEAPLPCIVYWNQEHFVVVYKVDRKHVWLSDPAQGLLKYSHSEFLSNWIGNNANESLDEGIVLLVEPTKELNTPEEDDHDLKPGFSFLFRYLFRYKKFITQLVAGLIAVSLIQFSFPFLTQSIVDIGIANKDVHFIYLILFSQLFLFLGRIAIESVRGWILLHLSTRINVSLLSDFFIKLMRLPISFFDIKMTGDIMQRINDHQRIENLLTNSSLSVLFSSINFVIFGFILAWYDISIFLVFFIGSTLYFLWVLLFMKNRRKLDHKRFSQISSEKSKVIELINGMQDIKLHNAERNKRWGWEYLQAKLFKIETKVLVLEQKQTIGAGLINECKNILIIFLSAKLVVDGQITLGMMLSISYITGQLNGPLQQLLGFIYSVQDARISLERLSEIHNRKDEENEQQIQTFEILQNADFLLDNIHFRYQGASEDIIKGLNITIPGNKTTAIVGSSGSGKTTLLKILLKFYEPQLGEVKIGTNRLSTISQKYWRSQCGVVMQDGYIFNDSIANNIALGEENIDEERLLQAVTIANIKDYIESLPLGYNTKIGMEGIGMSAGQKQRLFIARAVYKNPSFIFFDEATSALDTQNEREIMENLNKFFQGRTAVVIAHRLSTVRNADQIIVLEGGSIVECGNHHQLVSLEGKYYSLVKEQLDLERLDA